MTEKIPTSTAIGCCALIALVWFAWMAVLWWTTGVLVDWANSYYHFGWSGVVSFAFHLLIFLFLGSITSALGRNARKS